MQSYGLLQRCWSGPLIWDIWVSMSILCLLVGQEGYAMIHWLCTCLYVCTSWVCMALLPKSLIPNLQWTRYDWVIKQIKPTSTSASLCGDISPNPRHPGHPDPPQPMFIQETVGPAQRQFESCNDKKGKLYPGDMGNIAISKGRENKCA